MLTLELNCIELQQLVMLHCSWKVMRHCMETFYKFEEAMNFGLECAFHFCI